MNKEMLKVKEAVANGMREMGKEPSAFIFIDENINWTWDMPDVCGIAVYHAEGLYCSRWGASVLECPFIPIGRTDGEITYRDRKRFAEGYEDYMLKK